MIHLAFLVRFRNKVAVLLSWIDNFFTRRRPMRLITGQIEAELAGSAAQRPGARADRAPDAARDRH